MTVVNSLRRNIPAYAGKTLGINRSMSYSWEHPRVCGENHAEHAKMLVLGGTSPRMRGKLGQSVAKSAAPRNIPAYAGKTSPLVLQKGDEEEHPRVCGENELPACQAVSQSGTSPRMRGKRIGKLCSRPYQRNIPAYAGKTLIDVRFLVPEGHFTFGFVFLHGGGSMESP